MDIYVLLRRQWRSFYNQKWRLFITLFAPILVFLILLVIYNVVARMNDFSSNTVGIQTFQIGTGILFLICLVNAVTLTLPQTQDNSNLTIEDIKITPIKQWKIRFSYFVFNALLNLLICFLILILFICLIFIFNVNRIEVLNPEGDLKNRTTDLYDKVTSVLFFLNNHPELHDKYNQEIQAINSLVDQFSKKTDEIKLIQETIYIVTFRSVFGMSWTLILSVLSSSLFYTILMSKIKSLNVSLGISVMVIMFGGYFIGTLIPLSKYPDWMKFLASISPISQLLQIARATVYDGTVWESYNIANNPIVIFGYKSNVVVSIFYSITWLVLLFAINLYWNQIWSFWFKIVDFFKKQTKKKQ
ncbi:ABC transporter permease [Mycoplasmopsis sturni]|uniref:ABC transporter permease n=1 Tax=Mycoplasmopsis sturni TaxID=39047 RepID=UPI00055EAA1E|nr:ABC transporter permease [Mycoplasmopsis sturni]